MHRVVYDCLSALRAHLKFMAIDLKWELVMMVVCFSHHVELCGYIGLEWENCI